jgi:hypothetical protein
VHAAEVADSLAAAEFQIRSQIVWAKQHFALSCRATVRSS